MLTNFISLSFPPLGLFYTISYEFGPQLLELKDPWETLVNPDSFNLKRAQNMEMVAMPGNTWEVKASCLILGADEYLIIADKNGTKDTLKGMR